jgi:hypothetical protein
MDALETRVDVDDEMILHLQAEGLLSSELAANLEEALLTSRTIATAMGIIMAQRHVSDTAAFEMLRRAARTAIASFVPSPPRSSAWAMRVPCRPPQGMPHRLRMNTSLRSDGTVQGGRPVLEPLAQGESRRDQGPERHHPGRRPWIVGCVLTRPRLSQVRSASTWAAPRGDT